MEADSTEDGAFPPPKIYLSSSLPGSFVPIRAPLTIDSDSEFGLSNNDQICSRTSSFNSTSSIYISSYGDEHTSVHEEEDDAFLAYTDQEILIETCRVKEYSCTTPFVKYPDGNSVKVRSNFDESAIYIPALKTPCEESSSVADFRIKSGVPVAPLTSDCDSDIDSVEDHRWLHSVEFPADGIVQKVNMSPKVRTLSGDEGEDEGDKESQFEGTFSDDSINSIDELSASMKNSIIAESIDDEEHKVDCLNVAELQRIDAEVLSNSNNEIKIETISDYESESKNAPIEEERKVDLLNVAELHTFDAEALSNSNNEIKIETISDYESESKNTPSEEEHKVDLLNVAELHTFDAEALSNSHNEIKIETISDYESESKNAPSEEEHKVDLLNVAELHTFDAEVLSNSNNEIKIETISDYESESKTAPIEKAEETLVEIQPIKSKFLNLIRLLGLSDEDSTAVQLLHKFHLVNNNSNSNLTILAIGKTGVGKTATINSIFGENKAITHPYGPGTDSVQEIVGNIDGLHLTILDTPGLRCSPSERPYNLKILSNIKTFIRKHTPDVVIYVDRLDTYTQGHNDSHLLTLITSSLGSSIWMKCIIALTHGGSNDDDPFGEFVLARCRSIQEQIASHGGLGNVVWLVENHIGYKRDTNWRNRLIVNDDKFGHIKPLSESGIVEKWTKKGYFEGDGHRVKLFGTKRWSIACRLYS